MEIKGFVTKDEEALVKESKARPVDTTSRGIVFGTRQGGSVEKDADKAAEIEELEDIGMEM